MQAPPSPREVTLRAIGVIHSPHTRAEETPIQPVYAQGCDGRAEVFSEYQEGLRDLDGFSHIYLIYHFHQTTAAQLIVKPFLDDSLRGVFATRAPNRPNPIGFSLVRLVAAEGNVLHLDDVDVLDGTPLLDIKPFVERFDSRIGVRSGWQEQVDPEAARARGRRLSGRGPKDAT